MPDKKFFRRLISRIQRQVIQLLPMKWIIGAAVFEFLAKASADLNPIIGCNSDVATIKEPMDVTPQQEAVKDLMRAALSVRLYMSSLKRRERVFFRDCTGSVIGVCNSNFKGPLTKARSDGYLFAVARLLFFNPLGFSFQAKNSLSLPDKREISPDRPPASESRL